MPREIKDTGQEQLLKQITSLLEKAHIPYMITGSVGVIFYGRPRASHDIDFVIEAEIDQVDSIIQTFTALSSSEFIVQPSQIKEAIVEKLMFNILHLPTMLKLDFFLLKNELFDKSRFKRRKAVTLFGQKMTFASPEDTILMKLIWYKDSKIEKHLIDAAFVYQIQERKLNDAYLKEWAEKHKTTDLLQDLAIIDLEQHY